MVAINLAIVRQFIKRIILNAAHRWVSVEPLETEWLYAKVGRSWGFSFANGR